MLCIVVHEGRRVTTLLWLLQSIFQVCMFLLLFEDEEMGIEEMV